MIKFIASDLDGTLLRGGAMQLPETVFGLIKELKEQGIIFCAASGRQYANLKRLFGEVADDVMFICENGAVVIYKDELIDKSIIDRDLGRRIIKKITDVPDCEAMVCVERRAYLNPKKESFHIRMRDVVHYSVSLTEDLYNIPEEYVKISAFCDTGIDKYAELFLTAFPDEAQACVSGKLWLDFTSKGVNKGQAINTIMAKFGIEKDECLAFGDNFNDIEMFDAVGHPVVMTTANDTVKKHAIEETECVEEYIKKYVLGGIL